MPSDPFVVTKTLTDSNLEHLHVSFAPIYIFLHYINANLYVKIKGIDPLLVILKCKMIVRDEYGSSSLQKCWNENFRMKTIDNKLNFWISEFWLTLKQFNWLIYIAKNIRPDVKHGPSMNFGWKTSGFVMMAGRFFSVFMHFQARLALFS